MIHIERINFDALPDDMFDRVITAPEIELAPLTTAGVCCKSDSKLYIGGFIITDGEQERHKELFACRVCRQVFKKEAGEFIPIQGSLKEYARDFTAKHKVSGLILNSTAAELGFKGAHVTFTPNFVPT